MKVLSLPDFTSANPYQSLLSEAAGRRGVKIVHARGYKRILPIVRSLPKGDKIEVLHLHWLHPYLRGGSLLRRFFYASRILLELQILKWRRVGLVWTVHNLASHDTKSPKLEKWLSKWVTKNAAQLIVHSEGAKSDVVAQFGAPLDKVVVIPHGSYEQAYGEQISKELARDMLSLPREIPLVLFFGLVRPYKNVLKILDAWPKVKSNMPDAKLLISGSAPDIHHRSEVEKKAATLNDVQLKLEFIPDELVTAHFCAADIVVLPFAKSLTSGTISLAETYATPVVVPSVEGTRNARNATYAKSLCPADLAEAIYSAFKTINEKTVRETVTISWDEIAADHIKAYERARLG